LDALKPCAGARATFFFELLALRAVFVFCAGLVGRAAVAAAGFAWGFAVDAGFAAAELLEEAFSADAPDWATADAGPSIQLTTRQLNAADALRKNFEFPREMCMQ